MTVLAEAIEQAQLELAQHKHSPTHSMQTVAKRGIRLAPQHKEIDPAALAVGRKIASGQKLGDDAVEHMASYHAALDTSPAADSPAQVEHMLWGGEPGANWSAARMAALDVAELAQHDAPTILTLDQEGKGVSLEVFVRDGMGEKFDTEPDNNGLVWYPILRSGMLACRPGPGGEKKHDPLVFVPGTASDPHKEIGLENLVESYYDGAIQHVTIPTSHENGVLDNTGFIRGLKIVDSVKRPGEKVLIGAHDFRDPAVKEKVKLGTIANRSCGIAYDYVNTETGKTYPQALDHVALTNKPWVTGMAAYGESEFSDEREVVPMLLSEPTNLAVTDPVEQPFDNSPARFDDKQWAKSCVIDLGEGDSKTRYTLPVREPDGTLNANAVREAAEKIAPMKGVSLAQKKSAARSLIAAHRKIGDKPPESLLNVVTASTALSEAERKELFLADVAWGPNELSMNDMFSQVTSHLDEMVSTNGDDYYPRLSVLDVVASPDPKALVRIDYGDPDGSHDAWVIPLEVDGDTVNLSDFSKWTSVQKEWVVDEDAAADKQELGSILGDKTILSEKTVELATLTAKQRKDLSASDFVFPDTREYPIPDIEHGRNALSRGAQNETGARLRKIRNAVYRRYPALKPTDKTNLSLLGSDPLKGGAAMPTTQEVLERLELSEEQRTALAPMLSENAELRKKLALSESQKRKQRVTTRVKELQDSGLPPGFCKRYEEIALGDDGDVAAVLQLSEGDQEGARKDYSATDIAESLIACLPKDESGKLALAERANLLSSPISERPPVDAADQKRVEDKQGGSATQTADEWLAEAEKHSPGISQTLNLSTANKGA